MTKLKMKRTPLRLLGAALIAIALGGLLGACSKSSTSQGDPGLPGSGVDLASVPPSAYPLPGATDAARFLNQVTFGANDADIAKATQYGYSAILEDQLNMPGRSHEAYINAVTASLPAGSSLSDDHIMQTFWREAATGPDQLKRRVAFALSQIFVISLQDANVQNFRRGVANYMDMIARDAFGNYRQLLQDVTLHPMMGLYLSHLRNRKEDPATNRVPDQNYAREVMQLFSIGLHQLNPDGTEALDGGGLPIDTYGPNDIVGLSRVFTGFSWAGCANTSTNCFNGNGTQSPNREVMPMQSFPQFHSVSEKAFLGTTIPASASSQPDYSAEAALADDANLLLDRVSLLLTAGSMSAGTRTLIVNAVNSITMPATNQTTARLNRARLAVLFTLSSPDYLVQK